MPIAGLYSVRYRNIEGQGTTVLLFNADPNRVYLRVGGQSGSSLLVSKDGKGNVNFWESFSLTSQYWELEYRKHGDMCLLEWYAQLDSGIQYYVYEVFETPSACRLGRIGD